MKQNKKIAVTGGIGSGKSAVCALLKKRGLPVFSCDEIYAELTEEPAFLSKLREAFPGCVEKDALNRKKLSALVFSDEKELKKLNEIAHPAIMERLLRRMEQYELSFAEVPLLFEGGFEGLFDGVLVLVRDEKKRIAAVSERDGLREEEIRLRIDRQYDYRTLSEHCVVLKNDGTLEALDAQLAAYLKA